MSDLLVLRAVYQYLCLLLKIKSIDLLEFSVLWSRQTALQVSRDMRLTRRKKNVALLACKAACGSRGSFESTPSLRAGRTGVALRALMSYTEI
jgi:hypothetical protein